MPEAVTNLTPGEPNNPEGLAVTPQGLAATAPLPPGETAILVGGVVAGQGKIDLVALIALVWTCAVAGDLTSFFLGRRLGRDFLVRHGPKVQINEERLEQEGSELARALLSRECERARLEERLSAFGEGEGPEAAVPPGLDVDRARRAIEERVARPLGLRLEAAAQGILDMLREGRRREAYAAIARACEQAGVEVSEVVRARLNAE